MRSDRLFLFAALGGIASFAAALYFQYFEGLHPCKLCIWQRYALSLGIVGALIGWLRSGGMAIFGGALGAAGYLVESGIALYHTGVERKWWAGPDTCSGNGGISTNFNAGSFTQSLVEGGPPPQCDEIVWDFLGLSMANWNVMLAAALAILCVTGLSRIYSSSSVSQ